MQNLCRCRDLTALEAVIAAAFLVIALFGWSVGSAAVDPESLNVANWRWQLWQIGALLIAVPGVWWLWLGTQRVAWVRVLALGLFTLLVFVNTYTESLFGDYVGEVWADRQSSVHRLRRHCRRGAMEVRRHCRPHRRGGLGGAGRG